MPTESSTSRRQFIKILAGAGAWAAAGCAGSPVPPSRIVGEPHVRGPAITGIGAVDAHVHLWAPDISFYPRLDGYAGSAMKPRRYTTVDFLAIAQRAGVERAVLVQTGCYGSDHRYLLDVVGEYPDRFAGVGSVDKVERPDERLRELGRLGLRGVRVVTHTGCAKWLQDERMHRLFVAAADEGLVLDVLAVPEHIGVVDVLCERAPGATVVLDHLGRLRRDHEEDVEQLRRFARHPNVYAKVSGMHLLCGDVEHYGELIPAFDQLLDAFGPERLMWGSDAPYQFQHGNDYTSALEFVRSRPELSAGDRDWILRGTAESLFFRT